MAFVRLDHGRPADDGEGQGMNDTTAMGVTDDVAAYVREVRDELADLPNEDVDDLTGGMEADLTELAAECGGALAGRLGSPGLYAAELRAAAGLPERVAGTAPRRRPLSEIVAHARASFAMLTEQHSWLRSVTAFLVSIRPAWWLIRGYLAAWAVLSLLGGMRGLRPHGILGLALALVAMVVSVQLGRGWLRRWPGLRPLLIVGNAIAVVVVLVASTSGLTSGEASNYVDNGYSAPPGVSFDGQQVSNIYAYDSEGKRITGVRLFAQDGRPLDGDPGLLDADGNPVGVVRDSSGAPLLNVYPRAPVGSDPWQVTDPANPQVDPPVWIAPVAIVPLTEGAVATPTPTATPTATGPAPRATSNAVPSKSASPAPTVSR